MNIVQICKHPLRVVWSRGNGVNLESVKHSTASGLISGSKQITQALRTSISSSVLSIN